ncbi:hypothetical protein B7463_g8342, partial [Scytalidium lignicola]
MAFSNNHNIALTVGHGSGSGNGSLNNNNLDISLFSFRKEEKKEPPVTDAKSDGDVAILVGGALALGIGAATTWAIGKLFGWGESRGAVDEQAQESDPTTMEGVQRYLQH